MTYDANRLCVNQLWVIPKHFFVPQIVEKRKPLSDMAKRAGWVGCNILFDEIPEQGRIAMIQDGVVREKSSVLSDVRRADALYTKDIHARGWLLDVLQCMNRLPDKEFSLDQMYAFRNVLAEKHPGNRNILPKIRQQLQVLRDKGYVIFLGKGRYERVEADK